MDDTLRGELARHKRELIWKAQQTHNTAAVPIAYSAAAIHAFRTRVRAITASYLEALEACGILVDASVESEMLGIIRPLTSVSPALVFPPGIQGPNVSAVMAEYKQECARVSTALYREAANRLREAKIKTEKGSKQSENVAMTSSSEPFRISSVVDTLAGLKALSHSEQALLLLRRLIHIAPQVQNTGGIHKGNLLLPNDPYGLALGFKTVENVAVREHLLGVPWTRLVNEGLLVDPSGHGFFTITDEGQTRARDAASSGTNSGTNARTDAIDCNSADRTPTAFISYSWDSPEHKNWAATLAENLRRDGIDALIDTTHLKLGQRSPEFMERSVRHSNRVLVVCTEKYKRRFDNREGGAGYEGHLITGEIVSEVGKGKFIPVLRSGDWKASLPSALAGAYGVDLRDDSPDEYRKLLEELFGVSRVVPIGPRPTWLDATSKANNVASRPISADGPDPQEYFDQRAKLPDTQLLKAIWSKPRWHVWIRPSQFRKARFQTVEHCREFMLSQYVLVQGWYPYPYFSADALELGTEWVAGEIDHSEKTLKRTERWTLFRSGQFVHNRTLDEIQQLGNRVHVVEILDVTTGAFELAARLADRGVLDGATAITFELHRVDGRGLTWPRDVFGDTDAVEQTCWCRDEDVRVERRFDVRELRERKRELAIECAGDFYSRFGWNDPPKEQLIQQQRSRFGD